MVDTPPTPKGGEPQRDGLEASPAQCVPSSVCPLLRPTTKELKLPKAWRGPSLTQEAPPQPPTQVRRCMASSSRLKPCTEPESDPNPTSRRGSCGAAHMSSKFCPQLHPRLLALGSWRDGRPCKPNQGRQSTRPVPARSKQQTDPVQHLLCVHV